MGMIDLEALLRPISEESRCGPDLDAAGDPAYVELGVAAEWKEAKYVGEKEVSPASAPDWRKVRESASALLALSKDLRIAKHCVAALAHLEGLPGFARGVRLLRDLLDRYWDSLHPALEGAEDDWRKNLVMELNAERGALGGLRAAWIAESRKVGRFALRDIEALGGAAAPAEGAPTQELLRRAQEIFGDALGVESGAQASAQAGGAEPQDRAEGNGKLRSRADARRQLELVCDFLERTEPSHPAPLLIRRAARLLDLNFVDIIRDLAPEATSQIENLGGLRRE